MFVIVFVYSIVTLKATRSAGIGIQNSIAIRTRIDILIDMVSSIRIRRVLRCNTDTDSNCGTRSSANTKTIVNSIGYTNTDINIDTNDN